MLCSSAFPHFHISAYIYEFVYFRAAACLHLHASVFPHLRIRVAVRRISQMFVNVRRFGWIIAVRSLIFADVRVFAFLHFCVNSFLLGSVRIRWSQSIGIRRWGLGWNRETK